MKEGHYAVAKSFMLYRQAHTEDRETLSKMQFLSDYCESVNAATGSKYDANANVEHKNIATLIGELPKSNFIRLNRRRGFSTQGLRACHKWDGLSESTHAWRQPGGPLSPHDRCYP